jgi:hypothetical protein
MYYAWRTALQVVPILCLLAWASSVLADTSDAALGRRLYWSGIGADGQPIKGITQGDVEISGRQFSCVNCHRPSGLGTSEGGNFVPPVTGPILFSRSRADRNRMFKEMYQEAQPAEFWARVRQPRVRPAYDAALLGRALREGKDASGRSFDTIMPRYDLSDRDVGNLAAFLRGLSVHIDPGVDKTDIHFATVISPDADPARTTAVLDTINLFFAWMNKDTEGDTKRPKFSPGYRSDFISAYRYWRLHVWRLEGPPETWRTQLEAKYSAQPVFAVVSGMVPGPWREIGDFCNDRELPCIFPNTELPQTSDATYGYSIYFNRGLELEAEVLVTFLADQKTRPRRIVQIRTAGPRGEVPAAAFATAAATQLPGATLKTITYDSPEDLAAKLVAQAEAPDVLVLWPSDASRAVAALAAAAPTAGLVALPSAAMEAAKAELPAPLQARTLIVWPYEKSGAYHPRQYRVRAWMHSRRLEVRFPRLQLQTYYALTMLQFGLQNVINDFFRDYLIEVIEHEAENELNPGTHPMLALGPGQRFASKGAFIATPAADDKAGYRVVSGWIVP